MTGRTIPVTRTDDSEVAGEATQELIKAKTDNLDIALSALRDALRGTGNKTLTDLWDELASTLAVSDSTSHTTLASILTALSPLATDAKLEAVRALLAGTLNVSGPLTDTQLRAAAVAISAASLPLPSGAATSANQTTANTSLSGIDGGIGGASAAAAGDTGASTTNGFLRWMRDFWFALKGTKTAANSVSVTGASDSVFYVGGVSADGVAPTNQAVRVGGIDAGGLKRTLATDTYGYQYAKQIPQLSTAINITATNQFAQLAIPDGYNNWTAVLNPGSFSGTLTFQVSFDDGSNWLTTPMNCVNVAVSIATAATSVGNAWDGQIPNGATHVRVFGTTVTSGSATGTILLSPRMMSSPNTLLTYLSTSANRIGQTTAPKSRFADTTSPLVTATPSFTGSWRDAFSGTASGAVTATLEYGKLVTASAFGDQPFDLYIEVSENQTAISRWHNVSATAVGTVYGAVLQIPPVFRYWRVYAVKTGSDQTYFRLSSKMEAA